MFQSMPSIRSLRVLSLFAACAALPQTAAAADSPGNAGYVQDLVLNSSKSDRYLEFAGSVTLLEGEEANSPKQVYKWGGTVCSGYLVTSDQLAFLMEAMRTARSLQIVPSYKAGAGGARCLVSIKVRQRPAPAPSTMTVAP
jgi:hypothetical protein